jgi:SSS family transporter
VTVLPVNLVAAVSTVDLLIVFAYVLTAAFLGVALARGQKDSRDFFLAGHRLPTWALLLSIVATETSTVTFLSVPGLSFVPEGNLTFLQVALGYIAGRLAIIVLLLPGYFRGEMLTAYEVLERRYGVATRRLASLVFLVMRNLADGLRLLLAAMVLNTAFDLDFLTCVLVISAATAIYSCCGGVRSVVWNDCLQFGVYMVGAIAVLYVLLTGPSGGWDSLVSFGQSTGRFRMFDLDPSLIAKGYTFWAGLIGGAFLSLATHGADHMMVQRYLCARSQQSASWALALSGLVVFVQFAFFLLIGVALAHFFTMNPPPTPIAKGDQALITFVVHHTGTGLRGLVLAAVFSASMSSSLNAVTSSLMSDWFDRETSQMSGRRAITIARVLTIFFAVVQAAVAVIAYKFDLVGAIVDSVLKIAGFSTGLILGLFFLSLIVRASEAVALIAFGVGTLVTWAVAFFTPLHWLWYTLVGSGTIVLVGVVLSMLFDAPRASPSDAET